LSRFACPTHRPAGEFSFRPVERTSIRKALEMNREKGKGKREEILMKNEE
jgi:hypothetical protein